jgi:hypothetical protein
LLALVVASRFGMLLGLALWLGLAVAVLLALPIIERQLPAGDAAAVSGVLVRRLNLALLGAALLVLLGVGARVLLDRAAPPTSIVAPVAAMTAVRLLSLALVGRPAARGLLLTAEVCLAFYALYAVS